MNRIEIYKDDNIKIEIDKRWDDLLKSLVIKTIDLNPSQQSILLTLILDKLINIGWDLKNCKVFSCKSVPIIEYNKPLEMIGSFKIFHTAFNYIASLLNKENHTEIEDTLQQWYSKLKIPFYISLFEEPIYNVNGVMVAKDGDEGFNCFLWYLIIINLL